MVFSSLTFLYFFLPAAFSAYYLSPNIKCKNITLLICSLFFYAWGEKIYVFLMIFSILANFYFGLLIEKSKNPKLLLALAIILNLALLGYYKYANFLVSIIANFGLDISSWKPVHLPVGISFFTFQALSYVIDVKRKRVPAQKSIISLALYISMFPQLIAGPIVRYDHINQEIFNRKFNLDEVHQGMLRFMIGLFKKVIIANQLGIVAAESFSTPANQLSPRLAWLGIFCYTFQIYHDFSGYSDMAIGLGKMFGFNFRENFNYPYISQSVTEFWRRWHISLSSWFKDYLYIPLGGNRTSPLRNYLNLSIVFILCGLWHGASLNFIVWGAYQGFFLIAEKKFLQTVIAKQFRILRHLYLILVVMVGWIFFRTETLSEAFDYLKAIFFMNTTGEHTWSTRNFINKEFIIAAICALVSIGPTNIWCGNKFTLPPKFKWIYNNIIILGIWFLVTIKLISDTFNPFIYFRF